MVVEGAINIDHSPAEDSIICSGRLFVNDLQAATHLHGNLAQKHSRFHLSDETIQDGSSQAGATIELTAIILLVKNGENIAVGDFERRVAMTHNQGTRLGCYILWYGGFELNVGGLSPSRNARNH